MHNKCFVVRVTLILWNCTAGMNTLCPKDVSSRVVMMKAAESSVQEVGQILR